MLSLLLKLTCSVYTAAITAIKARAPVLGGNFGVWGGLFSTFDCAVKGVRYVNSPAEWNSYLSSQSRQQSIPFLWLIQAKQEKGRSVERNHSRFLHRYVFAIYPPQWHLYLKYLAPDNHKYLAQSSYIKKKKPREQSS